MLWMSGQVIECKQHLPCIAETNSLCQKSMSILWSSHHQRFSYPPWFTNYHSKEDQRKQPSIYLSISSKLLAYVTCTHQNLSYSCDDLTEALDCFRVIDKFHLLLNDCAIILRDPLMKAMRITIFMYLCNWTNYPILGLSQLKAIGTRFTCKHYHYKLH